MKIFDSIIFLKELDLLEMRLNILKDVVDYFVLTESPFTVSGNEKPLYYQENKDRFGKLNDKIIHYVTEEIPNDYSYYMEKRKFHLPYGESTDCNTHQTLASLPLIWKRGVFNRNNSAFGIEKAGATDDDLVITSDADEIVKPQLLENLDWFNPDNHYLTVCNAYYFKLNYLYTREWMGSRLCTWKKLKENTVSGLRNKWNEAYRIEDAGWHFSFLGDAEMLKLKVSSYEHQPEINADEVFEKAKNGGIENGGDIFGRGEKYQLVPIDDSYPDYIVENQEKYAEFIKPWN